MDIKKVVVIGSGATAATLIPAMAPETLHTTMLQRSPSYYLSLPDVDVIHSFLMKILPHRLAYFLVRWKNILLGHRLFTKFKETPPKFRAARAVTNFVCSIFVSRVVLQCYRVTR